MVTISQVARFFTRPQTPTQPLPAEHVEDKVLFALRRHRQSQLHEIEKEQLKQQIAAHNRQRDREVLMGDRPPILQSQRPVKNADTAFLGRTRSL